MSYTLKRGYRWLRRSLRRRPSDASASTQLGVELMLRSLGDARELFDEYTGPLLSYSRWLAEFRLDSRLLAMEGTRHPYWDVNPKQAGLRFASDHGVEVPRLLATELSIDELRWESLPDSFVLKPANGSTNRGVYALRRLDSDTYEELMSDRRLSIDQVVSGYKKSCLSGDVSANVLVEELLEKPDDADSIPDDFKVFCFYDRPVLVLHRDMQGSTDRRLWRFKLWTAEWEDLGPINYPDGYDSTLAAPADGAALIGRAESLGRALAQPAVRIDMYATSRGPVFGEFTMTPGNGETFIRPVDEILGFHVKWAQSRIMAQELLSGSPRFGTTRQ